MLRLQSHLEVGKWELITNGSFHIVILFIYLFLHTCIQASNVTLRCQSPRCQPRSLDAFLGQNGAKSRPLVAQGGGRRLSPSPPSRVRGAAGNGRRLASSRPLPPRLAELLSFPLSDWPVALSSPRSALRLAEGTNIKPPLSGGRSFLAGRTRCCVLHTKLRPFHPGDWHRAPQPPHHGLRLRARLHLLRPHPARRRSHRDGECKAPAPQDGGRPRHGGGGLLLLLPLLLPSEPSPQRRPRCRRTKLTPSSRRPESPWNPSGRDCSLR